jgi:hypothetical protein
MTLPAAGINMDGTGKQHWPLPASYSLHEKYVFHQPDLGKATSLLEDLSPQKNPLVTVRQAPAASSPGIAFFEITVETARKGDLLSKRPSNDPGVLQGTTDLVEGGFVEPVVGVLEQ